MCQLIEITTLEASVAPNEKWRIFQGENGAGVDGSHSQEASTPVGQLQGCLLPGSQSLTCIVHISIHSGSLLVKMVTSGTSTMNIRIRFSLAKLKVFKKCALVKIFQKYPHCYAEHMNPE